MNGEPQPTRLSSEHSADVAQHLAIVAESELPLAPALAALAGEIPSKPVAKALLRLSAQLERGEPLQSAVAHAGLPAHLSGIILAGIQSGTLAKALMEYSEHRRAVASIRQQVVANSLYPATVMVVVTFIVLVAAQFVVGPATEVFHDFGVQLPLATRLLAGVGKSSLYLIVGLLVVLATGLVFGPRHWHGAGKRIPLFGPIWRWMGHAEFCQLLGMLVEQQVALPQALRLTADGIDDAGLRRAAARLASEVERGIPLSGAIAADHRFARTLSPWIAASEQTGALSGGLATAAEMFRARIRSQIELLKVVLPPIMLVVVGWGVSFVAVALLFPMVDLIRSLSI